MLLAHLHHLVIEAMHCAAAHCCMHMVAPDKHSLQLQSWLPCHLCGPMSAGWCAHMLRLTFDLGPGCRARGACPPVWPPGCSPSSWRWKWMRQLAACAARCSPPAHASALCRHLAAPFPSSPSRYAKQHLYDVGCLLPGSFAAVGAVEGKVCCCKNGRLQITGC